MPLHVIGLGVAEQALLDENALAALQSAKYIIGSERQLATVKWWIGTEQVVEALPKLSDLQSRLQEYLSEPGGSVALLASGDPLFYGIGKWVASNMASSDLHFYPAVSSIQAACHRLGLALQDVDVVSVHGRPLASLRTRLQSGRDLMLLTDSQSTPHHIAKLCQEEGFAESELFVCEAMGYPQEQIRRFRIDQLLENPPLAILFDPLHVTCLRVRGQGHYLPRFPGIDDTSFVTDRDAGKGMISKREVRLAILSLLQPGPDDCLWDIGAGCGGVSVELSYWTPKAQVYAVEHHVERLSCLYANRERFGVMRNLQVVEGRAPAVLADLPLPNKVFIGGSGGELPEILTKVWNLLPENGVIVASAVTESTRQALYGFYQQRQVAGDSQNESLQVAASRGETLAGELLYRPQLPVTLYRFVKSGEYTEETL